MTIPIIDERIKHVGPATLRKMDALKLRGLRELMVIQDGDEPLAVLIPYDMYLEMQKEVVEGEKAIASLTEPPPLTPGLDEQLIRFHWGGLPKVNPDDYGKMPPGLPVTIDDGCTQNGGTNQNPDTAYSKDSYIEPANERRQVPRSGSTVDVPYPTLPDPKDIVVPHNDIAIPLEGLRCQHCGKEGADKLCGECFIAGHRGVANCQQCAENNQPKG